MGERKGWGGCVVGVSCDEGYKGRGEVRCAQVAVPESSSVIGTTNRIGMWKRLIPEISETYGVIAISFLRY